MGEKDLKDKIASLDAEIEKHLKEDKKKAPSGLTGEKALAELVAGLLFGLFFGFLLDDYFDMHPFFIITLIILGLAGSIYNIYKEAVKESK